MMHRCQEQKTGTGLSYILYNEDIMIITYQTVKHVTKYTI